MSKLLIAAFAATIGLASVSVCAKEVVLNDQEKAELRQRAERVQQQGLTGRAVASTDAYAVQHRPAAKAKTKKMKHKARHKARHLKPAAVKKAT